MLVQAMDFYQAAPPEHIKKERQKAKDLRKSQWWKQKLSEGKCHYCERSFTREELTMDHKIPLGRGGRTTKGNVVVSCKDCNSKKSHQTPVEMLLNNQA